MQEKDVSIWYGECVLLCNIYSILCGMQNYVYWSYNDRLNTDAAVNKTSFLVLRFCICVSTDLPVKSLDVFLISWDSIELSGHVFVFQLISH